jgi:hypothetical protein
MIENLISELEVVIDTWDAPHYADSIRLRRIIDGAKIALKANELATANSNAKVPFSACGTLDCVCNKNGACDCHNYTVPKKALVA